MRRPALLVLILAVTIMFLVVGLHGFHLFAHSDTHVMEKIAQASNVSNVTAPVITAVTAGTSAATPATVLPSNSIVKFSTSLTATGMDKPYELPLILPGLTAATKDGYTAVASSTLSGYFPWQAFDQGPGLWIPSGGYDQEGNYTGMVATVITDITNSNTFARGEYVELQIPNPFLLMEYSVSAFGPWAPVSWTVAGSTDGAKWTLADAKTNYTMPLSGTSAIFAIGATLKPFTRLRFIIQQMTPPNETTPTQVLAPYIQEVSFSGLPGADDGSIA